MRLGFDFQKQMSFFQSTNPSRTRKESNHERPYKNMYDWVENSWTQKQSWFSLFSNKENRKPAEVILNYHLINQKPSFRNRTWNVHRIKHNYRLSGRTRNRTWSVTKKKKINKQKKKMSDWIKLQRTAGFRFSRMKKIANQLQFCSDCRLINRTAFQEPNWRRPFKTDFKTEFRFSNLPNFWTRQESNLTHPWKNMYDWIKNIVELQNSWFSLFSNKENRKPTVPSKTIILSTKTYLSGIESETSKE